MKNCIALLMLLISINAYSQNPVEDAVRLKSLIDGTTGVFELGQKAAVNNILTNYASPGGSLKPVQENPFLKKYCANLVASTQAAGILGIGNLPPAKTVNTGSIIIDGLARFIVNRIKKELQAAFFERLYTFIKKPEYRDCRTLFPNTYQTLLSIGDQIYNYETYLTTLRNAFGKDLEIILPNLENVIRNGQYASFFSSHVELRSVCLTAIFITKNIKNGDHIGTVLEKFPATDPEYIPVGSNEENLGLVSTIQFIQQLSKSLKSSSGGNRYWVDNATLDKLRDPITLELYLGLLYQRVKDIKFGSGTDENFKELLTKAANKIDQLRLLVSTTCDNIKDCEDKLSALNAERSAQNYIEYVNSISTLLNGIKNSQPFAELPTLAPALQTKIDVVWEFLGKANLIIDNAMNIYGHLKDKKYTLVIGDVRNIYRERFATDKINSGSNLQKKHIESIFDFLFTYGTALAEMVEAKDPKEVYEAIDRVAAPVGSSKVKKDNVFSVSLNAYGGAFIGKEKIENVKDNSKANNYGVSAPIGLAFSLGKIKANKNSVMEGNKSITLFISIIDIGAPVSFRFQNDTLNEIPNVAWKDIIAPGASLIYGFGKVPISLAVGWQTGPNLRKVTSQYNDYSNSKYSRFSVGLYVDIPVFIFARRKYW